MSVKTLRGVPYYGNRVIMMKLLLCGLLLLTGCATMRSEIAGLQEGMDRAEVMHRLGKPDGFKRHGEYEALEYSHRLVTGWAYDRADYYVILKDGKVVEYGTGQVRVKQMGSMVIIAGPGVQ